MLSTDSWQQLLSGMPSDAQVSLDWFRRSVEFGAGMFNTLTGGGFPIGGGYVNTQGSSYQ